MGKRQVKMSPMDHIERKWYMPGDGLSDIIPICFGYHNCPPGHIGPGKRHYHLIHYIESGTGTLYVGSKAERVREGQVFIIRRDEDARYVADERDPWSYVWVGMNGRVADRLLEINTHILPCSDRPFAFLRSVVDMKGAQAEAVAAAGMMIISELFAKEEVKKDYIGDTISAINSLYMTDLSVTELAERFKLDRRYLSRIFHSATGMTIKDYIIRVRMESAMKHLEDGISVARTAELVGYNDPFYFSKAFKKYFSISPGRVSRIEEKGVTDEKQQTMSQVWLS